MLDDSGYSGMSCGVVCRVLLFVDEADAFLRKRSQVVHLLIDQTVIN